MNIGKETLRALVDEFKASGKDIDEFLRERLAASGREDAAETAEGIIGTLAAIDGNHAEIEKARRDGYSRRDWLGRKFNALFAKADSRAAGTLLARMADAFKGKSDGGDANAEYEGREARDLVAGLNGAIEDAEIASFTTQDVNGNGNVEE